MATLRSRPCWYGYVALGAASDLLVVLYYRAIQARLILPAVVLSVIITAVPYIVIEKSRTKRVWVWYAVGCGLGTALGMLV